ncbi:MAG: PD-(D/E)XK nuclease family protein [Desulfovibrionaceae bacterium]|nr:PD-(D/E)XK nuclease family protein [Desulfovibrionaceae bacterium]MBF0514548.1 PD-(D/E)XK nuclease family protein [Desulfovibrionaceae bacterium]
MITVRASSLSELFDCAARWEAKHVKNMRLPRSGAAQLGTAIHAGTAAYDASKLSGEGITADDAAGAVVDAIYRPEEDVEWDADLGPNKAEGIAVALHGKYCREISPVQDYVGVEVNCDRLTIPDLGLVLTGTTDRVRRSADGLGVADLKTGKTAVGADGKVKIAGHGLQLGVYELLASAAIGQPITAPAQIIGLQTGVTDKAQRVGIGTIDAARDALVGDHDNPGMLEHAAKLLHSGIFFGNPRSQLCSVRYCPAYPTCRYRA